jgi:hypothetical protein
MKNVWAESVTQYRRTNLLAALVDNLAASRGSRNPEAEIGEEQSAAGKQLSVRFNQKQPRLRRAVHILDWESITQSGMRGYGNVGGESGMTSSVAGERN